MTITNGYATLAQVKSRLSVPTATTTDDTLIEEAIESASREIDNHCYRRFYTDASATARVYYPTKSALVAIDDFYTATGLVIKTDTAGDGTYATTWASTDYELHPLNGIVDGESGWPYWEIKAIGSHRFPICSDGPAPLQVTAKWGWSAVPKPVYEACRIMAAANFYGKDVKFGSTGIADLGIIQVRDNPTAAAKLRKYRRDPVKVG